MEKDRFMKQKSIFFAVGASVLILLLIAAVVLFASPDLFSGYGTWQEGGVSPRHTDTYAFTRFGLTGVEIS